MVKISTKFIGNEQFFAMLRVKLEFRHYFMLTKKGFTVIGVIFFVLGINGCTTTTPANDNVDIITSEGIYAAYPYTSIDNNGYVVNRRNSYGYLPISRYPNYSIPIYSGRSYNPKYYYGRHYNPYEYRHRAYYPKYYNIRDKGSRVFSPSYKSSRYR